MARPYLGGTSAGIKVVSADATLVAADSGKTILMGANGVDITLPSAALGLEFQIIQSADYDTAVCTIVQAAATEDFYGAVYGSTQGESAGTDADVAAGANTKITFASGSLKGDRVRLVSDGTGWYVEAFAQNYAGITFDN
tara:strand:- start:2718 stop:3137 length:420 start_codon:yes stop_codon:yes gene_type:complete